MNSSGLPLPALSRSRDGLRTGATVPGFRWSRLLGLTLGVAVASFAGIPSASAYFRDRGPIPSVNQNGDGKFSDSDINVLENLGQKIPRGLMFADGHGKTVSVDSLLGQGKPILVTMGYYRCIQLCNLVHEGLVKGLGATGLKLGQDYLGLAVSVDPEEDPRAAATNEGRLHRALQSNKDALWPFLLPIGKQDADARRLAEAVGFKYKYDDKSKQFAHAAVAFVLSPDGKIVRYLYGVEFKPRDLRLALVEAGEGRVGTTLDRILLTCFKYDAVNQRYTPVAVGFVRIGALICFAALATLLAVLWRREFQMRRRRTA